MRAAETSMHADKDKEKPQQTIAYTKKLHTYTMEMINDTHTAWHSELHERQVHNIQQWLQRRSK